MLCETVTIIIPSYQPDEHLYKVCEELFNASYQILVIDDGSGEKYLDIFNNVKHMAKVHHKKINQGKGLALKDAFKEVLNYYPNTKYVITVDGDGQHKFSDIERMKKLVTANDETILGVRDFKGKIPLRSRIGNDMSKFVQTLITYRYLKDNQCGLRAFPISLLPYLIKIKGKKYEYEMNVISSMLLKNISFSILLIDTVYENNNNTSHFRPLLDTIFIQKELFKYGLINIFFYFLPISLFYVFSTFVIPKESLFNMELTVIIPSMIFIFLGSLLSIILFKSHNALKMMSRQIIFKFILLIINVIFLELFTRLLHVDMHLIYILSGILGTIPLFYFCKLSSK